MITNKTKLHIIGNEWVGGTVHPIDRFTTLGELDYLSHGERYHLILNLQRGRKTIFRWQKATVEISLAT